MKRLLDVFISFFGLLLFSPLLIFFCFLIWFYDQSSPFYIAPRVGRYFVDFSMVKLRSMCVNADCSGVDSTSSTDTRITPVGKYIRKYKLDEICQLWNVLVGDMSLVGPRPNVKRETLLYSSQERRLLSVRPGITDFASIIFSDEGDILKHHSDPDIAYHQLIRPGKSLLGLFYIDNSSFFVDLFILFITLFSFVSRKASLRLVCLLLRSLNASPSLVSIASRSSPLMPTPPPGFSHVVVSR